MSKYFAVLVLSLFGIVGCDTGSPDSSDSYSYEYSYNGCETGAHDFSSKAAYCTGLKDHQLNKGCAARMRRSTYLEECGSDWSVENIHGDSFAGELVSVNCDVEVQTFSSLSTYCDSLNENMKQNECNGQSATIYLRRCSGKY